MKVEWNKKYTTISVYAIIVLIIGLLFSKSIGNWNDTKNFLKSTISTLSPFIIGFLIAYFINPMVVWFEKSITKFRFRKKKIKSARTRRMLAILFSYIIVLGFIVIILAFIIPELATSLSNIFKLLPDFIEESVNEITVLIDDYSVDNIDSEVINTFINDNMPSLDKIYNIFNNIVPILLDYIKGFTFGLLNVIVAFIIAIYLLMSKEGFVASFEKGIVALFSKRTSDNLLFILKDSHRIFSKFFVGKLIDSLIIGLLCFIITLIAKIPNPLLISVFVGITNMIPYFGPFIGGFAGIVLVLIISPIKSLWFALIILALQQFDGNILGPKILGDSTGLSPFWVIFSIIVGGKLFGLIGMFLGVPFFAVIKNIIDRHIDNKYKIRMRDNEIAVTTFE